MRVATMAMRTGTAIVLVGGVCLGTGGTAHASSLNGKVYAGAGWTFDRFNAQLADGIQDIEQGHVQEGERQIVLLAESLDCKHPPSCKNPVVFM